MGRARRGSGDCAGKAAVDRAMQMAAQDALDLPIAGHDLGKGGGVPQPVTVHMRDTGGEGRVVHQDNSRPLGRSP